MEQKKANRECKILFYGDSITDGNRYKLKEQEWDLNHQMGHSYAYVINALLGSEYPENNFIFQNRGISGNRIIDLYARIDNDVLELKPDVLSILVGVNDGAANVKYPTDCDKFDKLYRMMLDEILVKLPDIRFVLCEPFVCNSGSAKQNFLEWKTDIKQLQNKVHSIAKDYQAIFIPLQEVFDQACEKREAEYWCWDGIHPTENGHGLIAKQWLNGVKGYLLENFSAT